VSSAIGFDFPDDGRGLAMVDWDHDGDLDCWLTNRSGPRVRMLENRQNAGHHFLAVHLEATKSNRDAIGARLELTTAGQSSHRQIRTVRAGDGFLSQSSRWISFGLGDEKKLQQLVVRWPDGTIDTFADLETNCHYRIKQSEKTAKAWTLSPQRNRFPDRPLPVPQETESARIVLVGRAPFPDAVYQDQIIGGTQRQAGSLRGPLLVNLWASWCQPCAAELAQWRDRAKDLRSAGVDVMALSVDAIDPQSGSPQAARDMMKQMKFPFAVGAASDEFVQSLNLLQRTMLDRRRDLPLPSSFLVDSEGNVAVIYKGTVDVEQILQDIPLLATGPQRLRDEAVPFAGRWLSAPTATDPLQIAVAFRDAELTELAIRYAQQLEGYYAAQRDRQQPIAQVNHRISEALALRGIIELERGRPAAAIGPLQRAVELAPENGRNRVRLAQALVRTNEHLAAVPHFVVALTLKPEDASTHYDFAIVLTLVGQHTDAIAHYKLALRYHNGWLPAANNLAWILATHPDAQLRDGAEAVRLATATCQTVNYSDPTGLDTLAAALAEVGQYEAAIEQCKAAMVMLQAAGNQKMAQRIAARLLLYQQQRPFRDPALRVNTSDGR